MRKPRWRTRACIYKSRSASSGSSMSTLPPKADICRLIENVRYRPKAEKRLPLFKQTYLNIARSFLTQKSEVLLGASLPANWASNSFSANRIPVLVREAISWPVT
jgi:hypothetical protein